MFDLFRRWLEERRGLRDAVRRVAEHRARYPNGYDGPMVVTVIARGKAGERGRFNLGNIDVAYMSTDDPEYDPKDKIEFTTMSGSAITSGSGGVPLLRGSARRYEADRR